MSSPFRFYDETEQQLRPGLKRLFRLNLRQNEFLDFPANHGIHLRPGHGYIDLRIETYRLAPTGDFEYISIPVFVTHPLQVFRIVWGHGHLQFVYQLQPSEPRHAGELITRTQSLQVPTRSIPIVRTGHPIHDFEHMTPQEKAFLVTIDEVPVFCQHDIALEET